MNCVPRISRPFLRFPGCKAQLAARYKHLFPGNFGDYHEPFLGSGALFFSLGPRKAYLSDINRGLISCYAQVKHAPDQLLERLRRMKLGKNTYYRVRSQDWRFRTPLGRALRFLFLNRLAFNGIWRVNRQGQFNTPYGSNRLNWLLKSDTLSRASTALKKAELRTSDYQVALNHVFPGDFVVLDPPYLYPNTQDRFRRYNSRTFTLEDHKRVARIGKKLARKGVKVMITNADNALARRIYKGFRIHRIRVRRYINSIPNERTLVTELVMCKGW